MLKCERLGELLNKYIGMAVMGEILFIRLPS